MVTCAPCHHARVRHILRFMKRLILSGLCALLPAVVAADTLQAVRPPVRIVQPAKISALPALAADAALDLAAGAPVVSLIGRTRPMVRPAYLPRTQWQHMPGNALWTRAALSALKDHGKPLVDLVPADIETWCPAYARNDEARRRAFWVGYMSTLARYESTYKPWAVGGGGRWFGLLQILPATARGYKCRAGTGDGLKNGAANLSCAVRIMAHTVARDGVIHGKDRKWRGVAADWGPMRHSGKRGDMADWLKRQDYCKLPNATRPQARPVAWEKAPPIGGTASGGDISGQKK